MKQLFFAIAAALALLAGPVPAQTTAIPNTGLAGVTDPAVEIAFWDSIQDSEDPALFLAYLEQFPNGSFRVIAKSKLDQLWQRAQRAFALLEEMGVSLDGPQTPPPVAPPAPTQPIIVTPAPTPPIIVTPSKPSSPGVSPVATPTLNRNTQNQLRIHGCYGGGVDGVWGPASREAMRKFNRRAGTSFSTDHATVAARQYMLDLSRAGTRVCR